MGPEFENGDGRLRPSRQQRLPGAEGPPEGRSTAPRHAACGGPIPRSRGPFLIFLFAKRIWTYGCHGARPHMPYPSCGAKIELHVDFNSTAAFGGITSPCCRQVGASLRRPPTTALTAGIGELFRVKHCAKSHTGWIFSVLIAGEKGEGAGVL